MSRTAAEKHKRQSFMRSAQHCAYCGQVLTKDTRSIDHVIPRSKGGPDSPSNWRVCCKTCNARKGSQWLIPDYRNTTPDLSQPYRIRQRAERVARERLARPRKLTKRQRVYKDALPKGWEPPF